MADDKAFETDEAFHSAVERQFDRREANHIPIRLEVQGEEYRGTMEDISEGGIRIQCEEDLPERGKVTVHVPYKREEHKEMHLTGVIRWKETISEVGIELTSKTKDI